MPPAAMGRCGGREVMRRVLRALDLDDARFGSIDRFSGGHR